jgi:surface protein
MANVITDGNIHNLVRDYINNIYLLPLWLYGIPIGNWDVSRVTNMEHLFRNYGNFNEPLNNWNVSRVTNMNDMFFRCINFNQPLDNWDVSNVTNMENMFEQCRNFNQPLNNWDVSNVTNMGGMFVLCQNFNQPLNNWNVSNVTNMRSMFEQAMAFNQPLGNWNVSNVTNMESMFNMSSNFNQPLRNWNVSNVRDMRLMFEECINFNQDLSNWDISNVRNIRGMFKGCRSLTINPNWQLPQHVHDFANMFVNTPLRGTILPQPRAQPQPVTTVARPAPQLPQGLAFEVHNAFADLDLPKFMTIVRRENNDASNFKDPSNVLEPVVSYINSSDTALTPEQKTRYIRNIRDSIRQNVNEYIRNHPEVKDNTLEVIQFVLSQDPKYKDLYIETFENECMGGYSSGNRQSCTKGMFERIYMANKGTIEGLCFEELQGTSGVASTNAAASSCKPAYLELYSAFVPGSDIDINNIFQKWYNEFSYDAIPEETNPLRNLSVDARKQHFRDFVYQDEAITPRIWSNAEFQRKLEQSIQANNIIFETLSLDAGLGKRRRKRHTFKQKKKHNRKTMKQRKATMKRLKRNVMKGKNKIIRKTRGRY